MISFDIDPGASSALMTIPGLQIALTQPIRLDDVVIVPGEWDSSRRSPALSWWCSVVVQVWDERRLVIPLQWFIEDPFQNRRICATQVTDANERSMQVRVLVSAADLCWDLRCDA